MIEGLCITLNASGMSNDIVDAMIAAQHHDPPEAPP